MKALENNDDGQVTLDQNEDFKIMMTENKIRR